MAAGYRIETVRFESGERLPMLPCTESGSPLWHPNLFLVTELRAAGLATNTLEHAARSVMIAHQVFLHLGLDIHQRITEGRLLTLGEVELLTRMAGLRQDELDAMSHMDESSRGVASRFLTPERSRMRPTGKGPAQVGPDTKAARMAYIRDYISWLAADRRLKLEVAHPHRNSLHEAAQTFDALGLSASNLLRGPDL